MTQDRTSGICFASTAVPRVGLTVPVAVAASTLTGSILAAAQCPLTRPLGTRASATCRTGKDSSSSERALYSQSNAAAGPRGDRFRDGAARHWSARDQALKSTSWFRPPIRRQHVPDGSPRVSAASYVKVTVRAESAASAPVTSPTTPASAVPVTTRSAAAPAPRTSAPDASVISRASVTPRPAAATTVTSRGEESHAVQFYRRAGEERHPDRPILFACPGVDGAVSLIDAPERFKAARDERPVVRRSLEYFDVNGLIIPRENRLHWNELAAEVIKYLREESSLGNGRRRPIYLMGVSFGGCLALTIADTAPDLIDRLVLLNPATSYRQSPLQGFWPLLQFVPDLVYNSMPLFLAPILINFGDPKVDPLKALESLMRLPVSLPSPTLMHRVSLLSEYDEPDLGQLMTPTLVLASDGDLLLPSMQESERLVRMLGNAQRYIKKNAGHTMIGVDLLAVMDEMDFLVPPNTP